MDWAYIYNQESHSTTRKDVKFKLSGDIILALHSIKVITRKPMGDFIESAIREKIKREYGREYGEEENE